MDVVNIPLQPSPTYVSRRCVWVPLYFNWGPIVGALSVVERRHEKGQDTISRYAVVELQPDEGRRFQLTKPGGTEVYYVELNYWEDSSQPDLCDCDGYASADHCKHSDSLRALLDAGHLPTVLKRAIPVNLHEVEGE